MFRCALVYCRFKYATCSYFLMAPKKVKQAVHSEYVCDCGTTLKIVTDTCIKLHLNGAAHRDALARAGSRKPAMCTRYAPTTANAVSGCRMLPGTRLTNIALVLVAAPGGWLGNATLGTWVCRPLRGTLHSMTPTPLKWHPLRLILARPSMIPSVRWRLRKYPFGPCKGLQ